MMAELDTTHLEQFRATVPTGPIVGQPGKIVPRQWAPCKDLSNHLPAFAPSRSNLFEMAADSSIPTEALCWSVLAWGGMHGNNRKTLVTRGNRSWIDEADAVRTRSLTRMEAYRRFSELKKTGSMPGLGPAYYTKLIFFLMPRGDGSSAPGYIMDQWVASAVNLLAVEQIVLMDITRTWSASRRTGRLDLTSSFRVSDCNDEERYESYCQTVEEIARQIGRTPADTELALMSEGGNKRQPWRQYVIDNRRAPAHFHEGAGSAPVES